MTRSSTLRLRIYIAVFSGLHMLAVVQGHEHNRLGHLPLAVQRGLLQTAQTRLVDTETWPPDFTDLDRAAETRRIFMAVAAERNATEVAFSNPQAAWASWLQQYNFTYNDTATENYRYGVFQFNLARARQLNQLAGLEVAFGLNRFAVLTPEEFLAQYTGDTQDDGGITISQDRPQLVNTPASNHIAAMNAAALTGSRGNSSSTAAGHSTVGSGGGSSSNSSSPNIGQTGGIVPSTTSSTPFATSSGTAVGRRAVLADPDMYVALDALSKPAWQQQQQQQQQRQWKVLWRPQSMCSTFKVLQQWLSGLSNSSDQQQQQQQLWHSTQQAVQFSTRRLQQTIVQQANSTSLTAPSRSSVCSKQQSFPYSTVVPFRSVDWLRAKLITPPKDQAGCSNSFAYVAASLAESTMLLQGYNGSARDLSEDQLLSCYPGASCDRGGSVHVLLNYLACNGFAAVGSRTATYGSYPGQPTAGAAAAASTAAVVTKMASASTTAGASSTAGAVGKCAAGTYQPVETGITGWSFVPSNEYALMQALSRTPAKVSMDAAILQSYRAGFLGCNVLSRMTNHALMAVGYNQQVRAGPAAPGSTQQYSFTNGSEYWMLKNSWGTAGSIDGFVYLIKGCPTAAPLGLMLNRGVIPLFNQTDSYQVGQLQCANDMTTNQQCSRDVLLQLAGFCAGVEDYLPQTVRTQNNCSCSCIPT